MTIPNGVQMRVRTARMDERRQGFWVLIFIVFAATIFPIVLRAQETVIFASGRFPASSWKQIVDQSELIVDARVQQVFGSTETQGGEIVTDVLFYVNRVFKGNAVPQLVVSELGGQIGGRRLVLAGHPIAEPNGRYILFLTKAPQDWYLQPLPVRPGIPRYNVMGGQGGRFFVDGDVLRLPGLKRHTFWGRYEGRGIASFLSELEGQVRILTQRN